MTVVRRELSPLLLLLAAMVAGLLSGPTAAAGQLAERLGNAASRAAESEAHRQVDRAVRNAIRCAVGDRVCQEKARRDGKEVVLVDSRGNPLGEEVTHWNLHFAGKQWSGDSGHLIQDELLRTLHLVSDEEAVLYVFLRDDEEGDQEADAAFLAFDSDERCRYPFDGAAAFNVWLDRSDSRTISGSYEGMVQCDYRSAPTRASGTFRVPRPR